MAIQNAHLEPIYNRLSNVDGYHPLSADAFTDWTVEAGDVVTVSRGEDSYASPVSNVQIVWKGHPQVKLNATGNEKRDSLAKSSKKKYGKSGAGIRNTQALYYDVYDPDGYLHGELAFTESRITIEFTDQINHLHGELEMTASILRTEFTDDINSLRGEVEITASHLETEFTDGLNSLRSELEITASHLQTEFDDEINSLRSELEITASHLETEFTDGLNSLRSELELTASHLQVEFTDDINSLRGELELTASHLETEFTDGLNSLHSEFEVTASYMRTEYTNGINSVHSEVVQTASSWDARVSGVVDANGNITAASIGVAINANGSGAYINADHVYITGQTTLSGTMHIDGDGVLVVDKNLIISGSSHQISMNNGKISAHDYDVSSGGGIKFIGTQTGEYYDITASILQGMIRSASVEGNVLTLTPFYGDPINFSKAVTLSGAWDGNTYTVTASPQGAQKSVAVYAGLDGNGSTSFSAIVTAPDDQGSVATRDSVYGYLNLDGSGAMSSVGVYKNRESSGSGYVYSGLVASLLVGPVYLDGVTDGKNATQINDGTWASWTSANPPSTQTLTLTTNAPTPQSKEQSMRLTEAANWVNNAKRVYLTTGTTGGTNVASIEIDASSLVTSAGYAGRAAVTISSTLDWTTTPDSNISVTQNAVTVSTSGRTDSSGTTDEDTKTINLYSSASAWSNNKCYVYVTHTNSSDSNRILRREVDASTLVTNAGYAGRAAVTISSTLTWTTTPASTITVNQNAVTVSTSGRTNTSGTTAEDTKTINLYSSVSSWDSNICYVYITHTNSTDANRILRREINANTLVTNAGYAGRAAVTISSTLTWTTTPASNITVTQNAVTVSTSGRTNTSGTASESTKTINLYSAVSSWSSNKCYVYVTHTSSADANRIIRREVDASTLVTNAGYAGRAAVTISDTLTWTTTPASNITVNQNAVTVSTSGRTTSTGAASEYTKKINLYSAVSSWSSNKCYVYVTHTSSADANRILRREVDASTLVTNAGYAGRAAVTLSEPTWNDPGGEVSDSRTVTVSTSGRTNTSGTTDNLSKSVSLYLTASGTTVSLRTGSTSGTVVAKKSVSLSWSQSSNISTSSSEPTSHTYQKSWSASKNYTWYEFSVTVSGTTKWYKIHLLS